MSEPLTGLYLIVGAALFALGLYGLIASAHVLRKIIALNVMANGVFLVFVATAARVSADAPDPVPHAMVLTGIVVAVCATGLALVLADRVRATPPGTDDGEHGRWT
ncbi:MAG: cation:proton antiporter subunit C [Burkholderiales bacterium]|nr:cation:proton antiporter subunit C [Burkholderiales bacterium]